MSAADLNTPFLGRKYLGTHRVTFLIGPDGRIKKSGRR
jgi:peroxiredoxin